MTTQVRDHDDQPPGNTPAGGGRPLHSVPTPDEPPYEPPTYDPYLEQHTPARSRDTRADIPNDNDAEQALLAALINDPTTAPRITGHLDTDDFWSPVNQTIWDAWHHLNTTDGVPPDAVLLLDHLRHQLTPTNRTARSAIEQLPHLLRHPATGLHAEHYARLIRDAARLREVQNVAQGLLGLVRNNQPDQVEAVLGEALQRLDDTVMRFGPSTRSTSTGLVDLSWVGTTAAPEPPAPLYATRTDGHALFYPAKVNGIFGDPEAAKTWLAMTAVIEALAAGQTAAMIDVDHNGPDHTAARLLLLGANPEHLRDPNRFRYYEPHEPDELLAAVDDVTRLAVHVLVIDSIGEVFPMLGVSTNDGDELTSALRRVCTRPAAAGCCVITIDHLPKSTEARQTGYAIGSIAKKRMIRGAYIRAEARTQPAPGQIGRITLRVEKDSTGGLRRHTPGGYAGTLVLDSTHSEDQGITTWRIERENAPLDAQTGTFRPTRLMELVSKYVEDNDQCSGREIEDAMPGKSTHIRTALKLLITEGFISTIPGPRRSTLHHAIALYREAEDDHLN